MLKDLLYRYLSAPGQRSTGLTFASGDPKPFPDIEKRVPNFLSTFLLEKAQATL